jgi:transposase
MLTLPPSVRIFVCLEATDMRKGFDGLAAVTREMLRENPFSGHLYVFFNRRKDRVKILFWDRSGLALYYKRIEKSRFHLAALDAHRRGRRAEIEAAELALILEGIDLKGAKRRPRFTPRKSA